MKPNAIATLVRWRGFQESCAADAYRRCATETDASKGALAEAQARLDDVRDRRLALLETDELDMARLQVVAQIEEIVDTKAAEQKKHFEAAQERQDRARSEHVGSRAQSRVAESRHGRVKAHAQEREEKIQFDRMADLHAASRRKP